MKNKMQHWFGELAILASVILVLGSSPALQADQIIQTTGTHGVRSPATGGASSFGGLPSFTLFDPSLGTLNSVTIKIEGEMTASVWVENVTDDPFGVTANPEVSITVITPDGALLAPDMTDSLRNSWNAGTHLDPGQSAWLFPGVDYRTATYTEASVDDYINPGLFDENGNPITQIALGLSIQAGAQGTFIPDASAIPIAYWFNEGDHREIWISQKIYVTLTYDYTPF